MLALAVNGGVGQRRRQRRCWRWRSAKASTLVLMALLPVSKSVDAGVDDVAAGQGVDGSVAVDGGVGQRRRRRQCWRWRSAKASTVVSMALLAVRASAVATMAALAVRGGGDRYKNNLVQSASHSNTR